MGLSRHTSPKTVTLCTALFTKVTAMLRRRRTRGGGARNPAWLRRCPDVKAQRFHRAAAAIRSQRRVHARDELGPEQVELLRPHGGAAGYRHDAVALGHRLGLRADALAHHIAPARLNARER